MKELDEFLKIKEWFPNARIKADYNREILDIGAEFDYEGITLILLRGDQTNYYYEIVTPECKCIEGLETLEQVLETCQRLRVEKSLP